MKLTSIQRTKVEEIISYYNSVKKETVEFKSPTGSGKTLMASHIISEIIHRNNSDRFIFIIATLSSSELPLAFEQKINTYKKDLIYSKFEVEYIGAPSTTGANVEGTLKLLPEQNKVFIFGTSTFGKGRIFTEQNIISDFITSAWTQGYKIIYIRDEAHRGTQIKRRDIDRNYVSHFEEIMNEHAHFIIHMTATPDFKANTKKVILTESELNDPSLNDDMWLLKTKPEILLDKDITDEMLLEDGLKKFKNIQTEYKKLSESGLIIRPALLIQVSDEPNREPLKSNFFDEIEKIIQTLNKFNLSWVKYFGNNDKESNRVYKENFSLTEISELDSDIDVIIFKVGPATGWDIPRACMLLQLRNVSSESLNVQTIGRIKRNPYPGLQQNSITDKYYVYSNATANDEVTVFRYQVKEEFLADEFAVIKIVNQQELKVDYDKLDIHDELLSDLHDKKSAIIQKIKIHFTKDEKGNKVFRNVRLSYGGHNIYSDTNNVFVYLKELEIVKEANKKLYCLIKNTLDYFYEESIIGEILYDDVQIMVEHLEYIILKYYNTEIKELIKRKINFRPKYGVSLQNYDPTEYVQIYSTRLDVQDNTDYYRNYLFNIQKNNIETDIQPLDSIPEIIVFKRIRSLMNTLGRKVLIWGKNMKNSSVSGEYIDENNKIRKSFFDFVIKFDNGVFLYIEVKSEDDIDKDKTKRLVEAYKDYFITQRKTLFEYPLIISLWKVNIKNGQITTEVFYDKTWVLVNLESLRYDQLLDVLSKL